MASITKTAKGYRAQVYVRGQRDSKVTRTRREAEAWAAARETELRDQVTRPAGERKTLRDVLLRYADEVAPTKRGGRWEGVRLQRMAREDALPLDAPVARLTPEQVAAWRDVRKAEVSTGTVLREIGLLSCVLEHARREWRMLSVNPVADVRKPPKPAHRRRVISWREARAMCRALNYCALGPVLEKRQAVALMFLVALRTGMRAGELAALTWDRVHPHHCSTPHKTGADLADLRDVPLEPRARRLIERARGRHSVRVFDVTSATLDALFRRARVQAGLSGFTFHDARHAAATRLARRVDVLTLCKIFGWSSTAQALTYYNPSAADIAAMLTARPAHGRSR